MKTIRLIALSLATASIATASFAQVKCKKPNPAPTPVISKVTAQPFQLKQVSTKIVNSTTSTSLYRGDAILTITDEDTTVTPTDIPVKVELRTQTVLNKNGDGATDGVITLYAPATRQVVAGTLTAINANFGELTGVIDGRLCGPGSGQSSLRAVFHGLFVTDDTGAYTLVKVDAHGVQISIPRVNSVKK